MRIIIASFIDIATQTIYNWLMHVSTMINSPAALNLQDTVTKNIRILMAAYGTKQEEFAADLGVAQSGLSRKLNRRTDWTMSDIANAACFFNISVADLVLPITFSTGLRPDYQVQHNVAPDNAESRELAGATGPRYIVRPTRKSAERTIRPAPSQCRMTRTFWCPRWDSNPHCADFEAASSTNWDTRACQSTLKRVAYQFDSCDTRHAPILHSPR